MFTTEMSVFPEAFQGRRKRLKSIYMIGFLAILSENIFSCYWSDEHSLQMKYQYKSMLLNNLMNLFKTVIFSTG